MDLGRQNCSPNARQNGDGADEKPCETARSNVFRVLLEYARTVIGCVKRIIDSALTAKIQTEAPSKRDGTADEKRSENVVESTTCGETRLRVTSGCDDCDCEVHPKFAGHRPRTEEKTVEDCHCSCTVGSGNRIINNVSKTAFLKFCVSLFYHVLSPHYSWSRPLLSRRELQFLGGPRARPAAAAAAARRRKPRVPETRQHRRETLRLNRDDDGRESLR